MSIFKRYFNKKQYDTEQTVTWREDSAISNTKGMFWKRFKRHKLAVMGLWFLAIVTMAAILAPIFAPFDPAEITGEFSAPPSLQHLLGTDQVGRDVLSRVIYAARVSLAVGIGAVAISAIIGTVLGLISGYFGGMIDGIVMRITDIFMSFPYILFILVVASIVGLG